MSRTPRRGRARCRQRTCPCTHGASDWKRFAQCFVVLRISLAVLSLITTTAHAQTRTHVDSAGTRYAYSVNEDGAVLTPMEGGAPPLHLGRSCDSYSPRHGSGIWSWANGGFTVAFPQKRFGFARQELFSDSGPDWLCSLIWCKRPRPRGTTCTVRHWLYLSTILDDYSRYIIAWKLCTTMKAEDDESLSAIDGVDGSRFRHRDVPCWVL